MARKNDHFTTTADEQLAARPSALQQFEPPAGVTLRPLEPPAGITLQPLEPPAGVTLQPLDLPGAVADPARQAHGAHRHLTSGNAPAAATGDGAPHET